MVSLLSLAFFLASASFAPVLGASALAGSITSPPGRTKVGPALVAACGQPFADYLTANPAASVIDLDAQVATNYKATCVRTTCGYYQKSDNTDRILTIKPRQTFSLITNIAALPPYPAHTDNQYGYTRVDLRNSSSPTSPTGVVFSTDYATGVQNHTITGFWNWNFIYGPDDIEFPLGTCATGCYLSWLIQQGYRKYPNSYLQDVYDQCIDFNIDWNGFQP